LFGLMGETYLEMTVVRTMTKDGTPFEAITADPLEYQSFLRWVHPAMIREIRSIRVHPCPAATTAMELTAEG